MITQFCVEQIISPQLVTQDVGWVASDRTSTHVFSLPSRVNTEQIVTSVIQEMISGSIDEIIMASILRIFGYDATFLET